MKLRGEKNKYRDQSSPASLAREFREGRVLLHAGPLNNETIPVREERVLVDFAYHAAVHKLFSKSQRATIFSSLTLDDYRATFNDI